MARLGLLRRVQPTPGPVQADLVSRLQDNVTDAIDRLTQDDDLLRAPVVSLAASANIPAAAALVVYRGGASRMITLPLAAAQGPNVGQLLCILNVTPSSVTVARAGADTVAGTSSVTLAAGALMLLASDGVSHWCKAP